jgi:methionine-rich copper-binding protein CopC
LGAFDRDPAWHTEKAAVLGQDALFFLSASSAKGLVSFHSEKDAQSMRRIVATLIFAAVAGFSGSAFAHAHLTAAMPAPGATVAAAPHELDLHFSEAVNLVFTGATLTGPDKVAITTGKASLKAGDDTTLIVPLAAPLRPGTYTVAWHALAVDGHRTSGSYGFTVK